MTWCRNIDLIVIVISLSNILQKSSGQKEIVFTTTSLLTKAIAQNVWPHRELKGQGEPKVDNLLWNVLWKAYDYSSQSSWDIPSFNHRYVSMASTRWLICRYWSHVSSASLLAEVPKRINPGAKNVSHRAMLFRWFTYCTTCFNSNAAGG